MKHTFNGKVRFNYVCNDSEFKKVSVSLMQITATGKSRNEAARISFSEG